MSAISMKPVASQFDKSVAGTALTMLDLGFTDAQINASDLLIVSVEAANIRYSATTTAPTATAGHPLSSDQQVKIDGRAIIAALQFIAQSGTAKLHLSLFKWS